MTSRQLVIAVALLFQLQRQTADCQTVTLTVNPNSNDESKFPGEQFRRLCIPFGTTSTLTVDLLEWRKDNGQTIETESENTENLQLLIDPISLEDAGEYFCRATLSNGSIVGPVSGGTLTVLDPDLIEAPPDQYVLHGASTTLNCSSPFPDSFTLWKRNGVLLPAGGEINNASLSDEGNYTCEVYLDSSDVMFDVPVVLHVYLPPLILTHPPSYRNITGNPPVITTVEFQGRMVQNTTVTWFKNGEVISNSSRRKIQKSFSGERRGSTSLNFTNIARSDGAVYRVVIENEYGGDNIPSDLKTNETSFQIDVVVPPAHPTILAVHVLSHTQARVTWELTNQNIDDAADTLTVTLRYSNQSVAQEYFLPGTQTEVMVDVVPGMEYSVSVSAHNQDGTRTSNPFSFPTPPAAPEITDVMVTRLNTTSFLITVTLDYTGGGDITRFTVSIQRPGSRILISIGDVPATPSPGSSLTWNGVVTSSEFTVMDPLELVVAVVNEVGFMSRDIEVQELLIPPGTPTLSHTSSPNSLVVGVHLSTVGSPPITQVSLKPVSPPELAQMHSVSGSFQPGESVSFTVEGLQPNTEYTFEACVVNFAGNASSRATFRTSAGPMNPAESMGGSSAGLQLWMIIIIAVVGIVVVGLISAVVIGVFTVYYRRAKKCKKQLYAINGGGVSADDKELYATHGLVTRSNKTLIPLSNGIIHAVKEGPENRRDGQRVATTDPETETRIIAPSASPSEGSNSPNTVKQNMEGSSSLAAHHTLQTGLNRNSLASETPENSVITYRMNPPMQEMGSSHSIPTGPPRSSSGLVYPGAHHGLRRPPHDASSHSLPCAHLHHRTSREGIHFPMGTNVAYGIRGKQEFDDGGSGHLVSNTAPHKVSLDSSVSQVSDWKRRMESMSVSTSSCNSSTAEIPPHGIPMPSSGKEYFHYPESGVSHYPGSQTFSPVPLHVPSNSNCVSDV